MEVVETFPVEFFVFQNNDIDNNQLISFIQSLENVPAKHSGIISLLHDFRQYKEFDQLFDWFNSCLNQIKECMNYDCETLKITNTWCNVSLANSGMNLGYHRHSLSFFSGVYYLTDGSPTIFEDPVIHRTQAQLEVLRFNYRPEFVVPAQAGKLCIFPSWMFHRSAPHYENNHRYIISFNTLPEGKVNHTLATDSKAEIIIK
jgi:uncharacterized protein (TIGR02466 family)